MPRFQFSLRTLLIVVTLLAIPCWWVGEQRRIVQRRDAELSALYWREEAYLWQDNEVVPPSRDVPLIRRWLGDKPIRAIDLQWHAIETPDLRLEKIRACFPEAEVGYDDEP